jgi:hypothetical protein
MDTSLPLGPLCPWALAGEQGAGGMRGPTARKAVLAVPSASISGPGFKPLMDANVR